MANKRHTSARLPAARDLRRAFLDAGLKALATSGPEVLSFRELARNLGVTTAAPYHHFRDRNELFLILATEGFQRLLERLKAVTEHQAVASMTRTSNRGKAAHIPNKARIGALTVAYLRFAREEPGYYRAMFLPEILRPENIATLEGPANGCFHLVCEIIRQAKRNLSSAEVLHRAVAVWSLLHGMMVLSKAGPLGRKLPPQQEDPVAVEAVTRLIYAP